MNSGELLALDPVMSIADIGNPAEAVPLGRALLKGGLRTLEVRLRSDAAIEAIERITRELPQLTVGVETVRSGDELEAAVDAGAEFITAPIATPGVVEGLEGAGLPFLCGCSTASEIAHLSERGIRDIRLFPSEAIGGVKVLRAFAGVFPDVRFCPSGGITADSAEAYLALPNVYAVGGSWVTNREGDTGWDAVAAAAQRASRLRWTRR